MKNQKQKSNLREWVESVLIAVLLALFIRSFFIQAFKIPTGSMRMTLLEGDRILVNKLCYGAKIPFSNRRLPGYSKPKRGHVVVFTYPEDHKRDFIKRLIAFGGETVEIKNGDIFINGTEITNQPIKNIYYYNRGEYGNVNQKIIVPEHSYFVLGDNSASSKDSRYWGFVPEDFLIGRADIVYWPVVRVRFIK